MRRLKSGWRTLLVLSDVQYSDQSSETVKWFIILKERRRKVTAMHHKDQRTTFLDVARVGG